jgi:integrase
MGQRVQNERTEDRQVAIASPRDSRLLAEPAILEALVGATIAQEMRNLQRLGRVQRRPEGSFAIDFGRSARRRRIYSWRGEPFRTRGTAEAALLQIRKSVAEGLSIDDAIGLVLGEGAAENRVGVRLERWLDQKRQEMDAGDLSPTYTRELDRWLGPEGHIGEFWSDRPVTAVNLRGIREWAAWLNERKGRARLKARPTLLSAKTRHNVHGAFHAFVSWLSEEDARVKLPSRWPWPAKGDEPAPTLISAETQDEILEQIVETKRGIFLALVYLGLRPGEAIALDSTDYRDGWLTVSKARKGEYTNAPIRGTKSGKVKRLPVPEELRQWIEGHHDKRSMLAGVPLFPNPDARNREGRWSSPALRENWKDACRVVGVRVGLYSGTKHSSATHLLSEGVDERSIQALLGHADLRSTRRYAQLANHAIVVALQRRRGKARADVPSVEKRK